jgi:hypothetical protein
MDGQDDRTSVSSDISHIIDVFTSQQSGDTSEESHVLAPRDDEILSPVTYSDTSVTCSDTHDTSVTYSDTHDSHVI